MENKMNDIIVIGSGPAGLTAAIYAVRSNLNTLVFSGGQPGGQLTITTEVEDFPGFPEGIKGPELMMKVREQAERLGAKIIDESVTKVDFSKEPFKVFSEEKEYMVKAVILASGATARWLGLDSEQRLIGRGVSACAVCDGPFFRNKKVAIVGGGDSAMKEALFLSKLVGELLIIHRSEKLDAFEANQKSVQSLPNVKFLMNTVVQEVLGKEKVEGLKLKDTKNGEIKEEAVDGLFIAIGYKPSTDFLKGQVDLDEKGFVVVHDETKTSVPGVFTAGDVSDRIYQQAITASGAGCKAALDAQNYLTEQKK
jgi:thioredoxin reductase (NADPH)